MVFNDVWRKPHVDSFSGLGGDRYGTSIFTLLLYRYNKHCFFRKKSLLWLEC